MANTPTTVFCSPIEDIDNANAIAALIDAELQANNVVVTPQIDGDPVILATVELTIVPPSPSLSGGAEDVLEALYQDVGWYSLDYLPGTGEALLELPEDFPTNERVLKLTNDMLPSCKCHYD